MTPAVAWLSHCVLHTPISTCNRFSASLFLLLAGFCAGSAATCSNTATWSNKDDWTGLQNYTGAVFLWIRSINQDYNMIFSATERSSNNSMKLTQRTQCKNLFMQPTPFMHYILCTLDQVLHIHLPPKRIRDFI